ncbi:uncharacterized protein LOC119331423 [Triticum dicoccoides]|uniref:uncharacterized protein LOC119331423 n=1 Tax=Triticum dicoccoides TaxID=85692 RepID=UPI001891B030|nr:uncharacterized protein LOC119331423 [Triticum dicoccoides]
MDTAHPAVAGPGRGRARRALSCSTTMPANAGAPPGRPLRRSASTASARPAAEPPFSTHPVAYRGVSAESISEPSEVQDWTWCYFVPVSRQSHIYIGLWEQFQPQRHVF